MCVLHVVCLNLNCMNTFTHKIVITTLACGQLAAAQVCAMDTGGAEADTSRWLTTKLFQNTFLPDLCKEFLSSSPVRLSDSRAPRWCDDDHAISSWESVVECYNNIWVKLCEFYMYLLKCIVRECWYVPTVVNSVDGVLAFPHGGQADPHYHILLLRLH